MGVTKARPAITKPRKRTTEPHYLRIEREGDRYIITDDTQAVAYTDDTGYPLKGIVLPRHVVEAIKERC